MAILGKLFGQEGEKYTDIREALFGDMPPELWPQGSSADTFPWSVFISARAHLAAGNLSAAIACWREIVNRPGLEPRHYLQAWQFIRQYSGETPPPEIGKELLGVVVEVGLPQGLDLLAAYSDHSARYYNFSGAGVVWERPDTSLDSAIDGLFTAGRSALSQVGRWDRPRPGRPALGHARISFLTPSGLHFGEGPMTALAADPQSAPVLHAAAGLMKELIGKANPR